MSTGRIAFALGLSQALFQGSQASCCGLDCKEYDGRDRFISLALRPQLRV